MANLLKLSAPVAGAAVLALQGVAFADANTSSEPLSRETLKHLNAAIQKEAVIDTSKVSNNQAPAVDISKPVASAPKDSFAIAKGKQINSVSVQGIQTAALKDYAAKIIKLAPNSKLTEEAAQADMSALVNSGYFRTVNTTFSVVKQDKTEKVDVVYHVTENPVIKDVSIEGTNLISKYAFVRALGLTESVPNMAEITQKTSLLNEEFKNKGYILARVAGLNLTEDGVLHVTIEEGKIEGYKISGNKHIKNYVIERELRQKPGEPFNVNLAKRSVARLQNLGFFDDVEVSLAPGEDPSKVVVGIDVDERNTATIGVGAGYSQSNGVTVQLSYTEKSLFGSGDSLSVMWEFGGRDNLNYNLTYYKPWLDKKETGMTINLYRNTREISDYDRGGYTIADYDKRSTGEEITFSRAEGEYVRNAVTLKHRKDTYVKPVGGEPQYYEETYRGETYGKTAEERRKENFGETRSITLTRTYDSRDNIYDPHHGKYNSYSFEIGGFGGDFSFRKLSADYRYYWELGKPKKDRMNHVLALNIAAGYAWGQMPLSQRFSVGGANLRGYRDDQFRGNSMLRSSLEYRIPIAKKVQALAFVDYGYAWDHRDEKRFDLGKMKTGYGVGLRFQSPIGPVRLDYGIGRDRKRFHFSFGGSF